MRWFKRSVNVYKCVKSPFRIFRKWKKWNSCLTRSCSDSLNFKQKTKRNVKNIANFNVQFCSNDVIYKMSIFNGNGRLQEMRKSDWWTDIDWHSILAKHSILLPLEHQFIGGAIWWLAIRSNRKLCISF